MTKKQQKLHIFKVIFFVQELNDRMQNFSAEGGKGEKGRLQHIKSKVGQVS